VYQCFNTDIQPDSLDKAPFQFSHRLMGHPALELGNLATALPALGERVMYSKGLSNLGANLDRAHLDEQNGLSIEETIEQIRTTPSYIAVRGPEHHPSFQDLHRVMCEDIAKLMRTNGTGRLPENAEMWLFIASPGAITPFHFDRFSNFLLQFRGSKEVAVFEPWNDEVITATQYEAYTARNDRQMDWADEKDRFAHKFHFHPGQAIHIPFLGGHYVKNGPEDVSISMAIFYDTDQTRRFKQALFINDLLRRRAARFGWQPRAVNSAGSLDGFKSGLYPVVKGVASLKNRVAGLVRPAAGAHVSGGLWLQGTELLAETEFFVQGGLRMVGAV
jgi:hypothetical protein